MHRTATFGRAVALLLAGVAGAGPLVAWAQSPARPEVQTRAPAAPSQRMPDPKALTTPPPPALGETPSVPAPIDLPAPAPRASAPPSPAPRPEGPRAASPVGEAMRVVFAGAAVTLPPDAAAGIDALAARIAATDAGRVQITAFADVADLREARRLSLARAEAVRSRFVEKGVRSDRINLRPFGDAKGDGPADRADILIVN